MVPALVATTVEGLQPIQGHMILIDVESIVSPAEGGSPWRSPSPGTTIDAMVRDRATIGKEVFLRRKAEQDAINSRNRTVYFIFWFVIAVIIAMYCLGSH